jgi:riboflavin kinase/FMN adenylyltransferase
VRSLSLNLQKNTLRIFRNLEEVKGLKNPVVTIGTFDGVHLGHQKIISQINDEAKKIGGESVLFTFFPHPRMVLYPDNHNLKLIQTQSEKLVKLDKLGLQNVIEIPFTFEFSRLTALEFVRNILVNALNVKTLIIGYDHQFGKNREGTITFLKSICGTYDFNVIEIPPLVVDDLNISSTKIRDAIKSGNMLKAAAFLGENYALNGIVVHGKKLGRTLGFPTANIQLTENYKLAPGRGVYAVEIVIDGTLHNGMANIGLRPTVNDSLDETIEVNVFDFNSDIYNKNVTVFFYEKIRDEIKFKNKEELINQLHQDEKAVRDLFNRV